MTSLKSSRSYQKILRSFLLASVGITLVACSSTPPVQPVKLTSSRVEIRSVELTVTDNVNEGHPLNAEFVAIEGDKLAEKIGNMTSKQWFAEKKQLIKQNSGKLTVWPLKVTADSNETLKDVPFYNHLANKVILFADYQSKGAHRLEIDHKVRHLKIELRDDDAYWFK